MLLETFLARMTVWTRHCIYVRGSAQVPLIDACRQLTQGARLTQGTAAQGGCETQRAFTVFYKVQKQIPSSGLGFHADLTTDSKLRAEAAISISLSRGGRRVVIGSYVAQRGGQGRAVALSFAGDCMGEVCPWPCGCLALGKLTLFHK